MEVYHANDFPTLQDKVSPVPTVPLVYDSEVAFLSENDCPFVHALKKEAQEQKQEIYNQSNISVIADTRGDFGYISEDSVSATQVQTVLIEMEKHFTDKFCKFIQKQQERTLRRDAFRVWGKFAVDMAAEKRLCNIVQTKQECTLRRGAFRAWRLGGKNQIEALETEIETLNERVRVLEQQKTGQPDIDHIASELAKRGLLVSNKSQTVQQTAAAQSHVTAQQPVEKTSGGLLSYIPSLFCGRKSPVAEQSQPPEPSMKSENKSESKSESEKDPHSDSDMDSKSYVEPETESEKDPQSDSEMDSKSYVEPETESEKDPQSDSEMDSKSYVEPKTEEKTPLSPSVNAPPPPLGSGLPPPPPPPPPLSLSQGVLPTTNMSDTPVSIVSRLPRQKEKSSQNAPQMTSISAVQEAQFKALMRHERNGTNLRDVMDVDKYDETIRAFKAYKARITSTDAVAPRKRVLSEKSQKINANIEAQNKEALQRAQPRTLMGQGLKKKFGNVRAASSGDEAGSGFSTSDDEQNSVSSEKELSIVVEPKGTAEQETPTKEDNVEVFSMLSLLLGDT